MIFRVGDTVNQNGHHIWNITKVDGDVVYYDVVYHDHVSPNKMTMKRWHIDSKQLGWAHVPRKDFLPEELFYV